MLNIEIAYASENSYKIIQHHVAAGSTVLEVLNQLNLEEIFPGSKFNFAQVPYSHSFAIFGVLKKPEDLVNDKDRIEILRDLKVDPKEARRKRVK